MKKLINYILIACIFIACDKIEDPWADLSVIPQTFSAYTPEFGSQTSDTRSSGLWEYQPESWDGPASLETRTYAFINPNNTNEYIQYWSESDAISVFFNRANLHYTFTAFNEVGEYYGIFQLNGEATTGSELQTDYYYAVYPYKTTTSINYTNGEILYNFPATQHYKEDSYSDGENGMIAFEPKDDMDGKWYFQNFCSYLQLRMVATANNPKKVKQIILVANDPNDKMSGDASIKMASGIVPEVEMMMTASNQLTLDCGEGVDLSLDKDNPTKFWFVLPGDFTFTKGFKITITFDDNTYFEKSTEKHIQTILRSHIRPMATFNTVEEEDGDFEMTGPIRYKYNEPSSNEQPYPIGGEFYGENGEKLQVINQVFDEETGEWVVYLSGKLKTIGGNNFQKWEPDIEYIKIKEETDDKPIIIGDFAFYNSTADFIEIHNNVESIGLSALKGSDVEKLTITGDVNVISEAAFSGSKYLKTLNVNSVNIVGARAFYMCNKLEEVSIPGAKSIGISAFEDCESLKSILLNSVETIEDAAFMGCTALTYVEISAACIMIGEGAFCNARALETVICKAQTPPFIKTDNTDGSYVFDRTHKNLYIYIPVGSMGDYTNKEYFANNSGYDSPIQATVNWWAQEYSAKLHDLN